MRVPVCVQTDSVLNGFLIFPVKRIVKLDIDEFPPSLNEDILTNAIQFAKLPITIDDNDGNDHAWW